MIFKPYPEYKDSDVPWLGKVPKEWEKRNFRTILTPISEKNHPDFPLLSVVREKGVIIRNIKNDDENHNVIPEDLTNYKVVKIGQFAMNKMKAWQGSYGISKYNGIVSPAYFVFNLNNVEPHFFHIALRSKAYIPLFTAASDGIRIGQWDLSLTRMKEIPFYIPSLTEQIRITRFLDWKISQIVKFIKVKKRIIELLKEQKQVIINDSITGKINVATGKPYPKYKDSGVEWLGKVPEEWEVIPIKHITKINPSKSETGLNNQSSEKVVFLPMERVSIEGIIDCTEKKEYKDVCSGFSYFKKNDVVVAKITPCFENGKGAFLNKLETDYGFGTTEFITLRPANKIYGKYLRIILSSKWFIKIVEKFMTGSAGQKRISSDFIGNFKIILPELKLQTSIVKFIESKTNNINLAISHIEHEISLIQEYRDRLIADVVTGKVDARDIKVSEVEEEIDGIVEEDELDESINDEEKKNE